MYGPPWLFDVEGTISGVLSFIGVRCFGDSTFEDIDVFNVGGKAIETLFPLVLDVVVVFKREVYFHESITEYANNIVWFNKVAVLIGM
jgi:hypothetical protein